METPHYEQSFEIILENLQTRRSESFKDVFNALIDFKENVAAKNFIIGCLEGDDEILMAKAQHTIAIRSWRPGMTLLKENILADQLKPENKQTATFNAGIEQLKKILK